MQTGLEMLADGHCLVSLFGEVDLSAAPDLVAELEFVMDQMSPHILIDLSQVNFIDSSGLNALIHTKRTALARGGSVTLTCADESLRQLLRMTRLDQFFEIRAQEDWISLRVSAMRPNSSSSASSNSTLE